MMPLQLLFYFAITKLRVEFSVSVSRHTKYTPLDKSDPKPEPAPNSTVFTDPSSTKREVALTFLPLMSKTSMAT